MTTEEIMALPVFRPYRREWDAERKIWMEYLIPTRASALACDDDDLFCVVASDGLWRPIQVEGVWYRQRI